MSKYKLVETVMMLLYFYKKQHALRNSNITQCLIGNEQEQNIMLELNSSYHYLYMRSKAKVAYFQKSNFLNCNTLLLCLFVLYIVKNHNFCLKK